MSFSAKRKRTDPATKWLHEHGRDKSPDDIEIYPSKNPETAKAASGKIFAAKFGAVAVPSRIGFTLRRLGRPFNYQGVITKSYNRTAILTLLDIHRSTLDDLMKREILPAPFVTVTDRNGVHALWFYHQVQPVCIWYAHMRARGIQRPTTKNNQKEIALLKRNLHNAEVRFMRMLGVEYVDEYTELAGRYGVIPLDH